MRVWRPAAGVDARPTFASHEARLLRSGRMRIPKLALTLLAFAAMAFAAQKYQPAAIWEWQENVITDPADQSAFFAFAGTHGIDTVYIECESAIQNNQPALIGFLEAAAGHGLTAELLFGDAEWVLPGSGYPYQGYAVSLVSVYTAQLLSQMTTGKPVAVHYDVEPYSLKLWKTEQNTIALDYISLASQLEAAAQPLGLKLSVDVPYWYSTIPVRLRKSITFTTESVARMDRVVPFAVEFVGLQIDMGEFFIRDLSANRVSTVIQPAGHF